MGLDCKLMAYEYKEVRHKLFTEEGQVMLLAIRDNVHRMLADSGAFRMKEACMDNIPGDSWAKMACVDRLVELGEIKEISDPDVPGMPRVFVSRSAFPST